MIREEESKNQNNNPPPKTGEPSADPATAGQEVSLPKAEYEALLARLKDLEGLKDQLLRSAADFDNAKKRLLKEREEFIKFSQENLIRELLPVLDNFDRALAHLPETKDPSVKGVIAGIQMVFKQISEILKNQGLKRLETAGKTFDPHCHEAVGYVEKGGREDEIIEEVEPGYMLHDRLLRAAKVRVQISSSAKKNSIDEEKQEEIT